MNIRMLRWLGVWGCVAAGGTLFANDLNIERPRAPELRDGSAKAASATAASAPAAEVRKEESSKPLAAEKTSAAPAATGILVKYGHVDQLLASKHDQPVWWHFNQRWPVYVIDFPNVENQSRVFSRIIVYIERLGTSRTQVASEAQLAEWLSRQKLDERTLTVGNNYRVTELVAFFNAAQQQKIALRAEENWLLDGLRMLNLVAGDGRGFWKSNSSAVILSVPQVSEVSGCAACNVSPEGRKAVFEHEFAHAVYSSNEALSQYLKWYFQNRLPAASRKSFIGFLGMRGYDTESIDIVVNEFYAFLLHTPDRNFFDPLQALGVGESELKAIRDELNLSLQPMLEPPAH